jgi:NAD(P)H-nitrite reductase large subunit
MKALIIGAGPAGVAAAETLRAADPRLEIVMISREPCPPYSPPLLASYFLEDDETIFWKGREFAARNRIQYLAPRTVVRVDSQARTVRLHDGANLGYDRLIIASGSGLYSPVPWVGPSATQQQGRGLCNFKSLSAVVELRRLIRSGRVRSAVVVGAGFIGTEVAIALRESGLDVTQVEMADRVMPRMLDPDTAAMVRNLLEEKGIRILLEAKGEAFFGDDAVEGLELASGERIHADVLIAATGVRPNVAFLDSSLFDVQWGLVVDDYLRTSAPDVFAAGDCAEVKDRITGQRYVHAIYLNAVEQGRIAARNALGEQVVYEGAHNMNSLKHLGIPLVALGGLANDEELTYSDGKTVLKKLFLTNGRLTGARLAGDIGNAGVYFWLMNQRVEVSAIKRDLLSRRFNMAYLLERGMMGESIPDPSARFPNLADRHDL